MRTCSEETGSLSGPSRTDWVMLSARSDAYGITPVCTSLAVASGVQLLLQVAHRLMAVEVARLLLAELPDPYSASSAILPGSLPAPTTAARVRIE